MDNNLLEINDISFNYFGGYTVFANLSLCLKKGEKFCLLGSENSGKSTFVKLISGLEKVSSGVIMYNNKDINSISIKDRNFAQTFKDYQFRKHKNVFYNIAKPLILRKLDKLLIADKVKKVADAWGIADLFNYKIEMLSNTQKALVAFARMFVIERDVYLLNNPLENLYFTERNEVMKKLFEAVKNLDAIVVFTTDRVEEAEAFNADFYGVLSYSTLSDTGSLKTIYEQPQTLASCKLIASDDVNFLNVKIANGSIIAFGVDIINNCKCINDIFEDGVLAVYPDEIKICKDSGVVAEIVSINTCVKRVIVAVKIADNTLKIAVNENNGWKIGDKINLEISCKKIKLYDTDSEKLITV